MKNNALLLLTASFAGVLAACGGGNNSSSDGGDGGTGAAGSTSNGGAGVGGSTSNGGATSSGGSGAECAPACGADLVCKDQICCKAPVASGAFQLPAHTAYIHWHHAAAVATLEFDLTIHDDPGDGAGMYFALTDAFVGATQFYLGIQTSLFKEGSASPGKGFIYSRFDTIDLANARVNAGGYSAMGTSEGQFIGVRLPYAWHVGDFHVRLARAEGDDMSGDWFDLYATDMSTQVETFVGGLRFPRATPGVAGTIAPEGTSFAEVYSDAADYASVPAWHVSVMSSGDGALAVSAEGEYPAYPYAEYPNVDEWYDKASDRVHVTFGGQTPKCHPAGALFKRAGAFVLPGKGRATTSLANLCTCCRNRATRPARRRSRTP